MWKRRARQDEETRQEIEDHLARLTDRYIRSGMTPEQAATAARRQFGNPALLREDLYAMHGVSWFDVLRQDLRYALRQLRHAPAFAAVVIATLALGIGGATAVFTVFEGVLLAALPFEESPRLVRFYQQEPGKPDTRAHISGVHFVAARDAVTAFDQMAALNTYSDHSLDLFADGQARRIRALQVTAGYFETLRVGLRGPGFSRADDSGSRRVVLSDALWRTVFHANTSLVGSTIRVNGRPIEVAGIAPPAFVDPIAGEVDAWVPYAIVTDLEPQNYSLSVIARLRDGVSLEQAEAELAALAPALSARWPAARRSQLVPLALKDDLVDASRRPLYLMLAAVGLMLLVACVNVANLVLVRATGRAHEFALRAALGSGRARLASQLLMESVVLSVLGGTLGLAFARLGIGTLRRLAEGAMPRLHDVGFNVTVLAFAALVTAATAITFGLVPALRLAATAPNAALRRQSRSATGTKAQGRMRNALAAVQLALALTLLAGAAALVESFVRLRQVNLGFRTDRVLTFQIGLPSARYDETRRAQAQEELSRRIAAIPGVSAAGGTSRLPATGNFHPWTARILTGPRAGDVMRRAGAVNLQNRTISGRFFEALGIPILAGRAFDDRDDANAPGRAVVSASFAREAFPGVPFEHVIGQRIAPLGQEREIIGVSGDVTLDVYGAPAHIVYHAHRQFAANRNWVLTQVVATRMPPDRVLPSIRAAVAGMDPELVVYRPGPLADVVGRGVARERFALVLVGCFAGVAVLLALVGLYGVLAYTVRQRTREIGIRMALGATASQVRGLILRQAGAVVVFGVAGGLTGALVLGRSLSSLLFQVSATDARILLATAGLLAAASLVSAWVPARRAARLEPGVTMQEG